MPGPPRKPTPLLKLAGSWRGAAREKVEPKLEPGRPSLPEWLDEEGRAAWERLCPLLERMKVLTVADETALSMLCETWSRYRRASQKLAEFGDVYPVKNPDGTLRMLKRSPYSSMQLELARILRGQLAEFGLTPATRGRLIALPGGTENGEKASYFTRRASGA